MLFNLYDEVGAYLGTQSITQRRNEPIVKILPGVVLFQIWIHARKR
jgi:hypothetical protein